MAATAQQQQLLSRQLSELEALLRQLAGEHRKLIKHVEAHQAAMRVMDLKAMDAAANQQEASRLRIATAENKRRMLVSVMARSLGIQGDPTVSKIADCFPQNRVQLLMLRDDLRTAIMEVAANTNVTGKLAGAVLGHLNTVVRMLAGAVQQAGIYTKNGVPQVTGRIGVLEAVG
jgi:hypothetical protein